MNIVKPSTNAEKTTGSTVDTIIFSPEEAQAWRPPLFQRPLKVNAKVRELAEGIKRDKGVVPGILTLGKVGKDPAVWLVDGQHRIQAFLMSMEPVGYADVRTIFCPSMADLGNEFVNLNSHLVRMSPDDVLRGLESSTPSLQKIRKTCPFVGYDQIRRRANGSSVLSMSQAIRAWNISSQDVPGSSADSAPAIVGHMCEHEVDNLIKYLTVCDQTWGRDPAYWPLWKMLNLTLVAWIYRRQVLAQPPSTSKAKHIAGEYWPRMMMALSTDGHYLDWLTGRQLTDRDRSPAYQRCTTIMGQRYTELTNGIKMIWLRPPWSLGQKC